MELVFKWSWFFWCTLNNAGNKLLYGQVPDPFPLGLATQQTMIGVSHLIH